ncbi:MAG: transcription termination/antitermination protein NusG [Oceanipulchritudo sp.]
MPDLTKTEAGWYCFKALPKKEHIAASLLNQVEGLEALCPRISYMKKTRRGKVRFVECLFPGYVFVHGDLQEKYRLVRSTQGIRDVVSFGERVPRIPDVFIDDLKRRLDEENVAPIPEPALKRGQEVTITEGPFRDWRAVVSGELDARQRVALLLDFLGRQMEIKVPVKDLISEEKPPKGRVWDQN